MIFYCVISVCKAREMATTFSTLLLLSTSSSISSNAPLAHQWQVVNQSNVHGDDYKLSSVWEAGDSVRTAAACQQLCETAGNCTSFDWAPGDNPGKACEFTHQCWLRADTVWHPKIGKKCRKVAGRKVAPTPPPTPPPSPSPAPSGARNVLFVIFDDRKVIDGTWDMGPQPHTPNADELGRRALAFDRAYCNQAVCGPSRASLLSGRRPDTTQMWNFVSGFRQTPGAENWNTWPEYFKKHGYFTYGVGKLL